MFVFYFKPPVLHLCEEDLQGFEMWQPFKNAGGIVLVL